MKADKEIAVLRFMKSKKSVIPHVDQRPKHTGLSGHGELSEKQIFFVHSHLNKRLEVNPY